MARLSEGSMPATACDRAQTQPKCQKHRYPAGAAGARYKIDGIALNRTREENAHEAGDRLDDYCYMFRAVTQRLQTGLCQFAGGAN